ncbi:MAG: hypothetical protein HFH86_04190 [Bacilli bacterium]|jgi:hypothetical protein|nr:hypothetical protein [Bacilli bacterium]
MDEKFSSIEELYARLLPALKSKENELHKNHMIYITEKDIWNYFRENKWNRGVNLTLFDMVDDILNTDNDVIDEYVRDLKRKDYY